MQGIAYRDSLRVGLQFGEQLSSTCRGGFFTGKRVEYIHHGASFLKLAPSAGRFPEENVQRMRSERPRDALASQHHLDASKSIQVTLAKYEASDGRYDLSSIGHSPTKSVRWMTVFSVSIGHFELQFLIGAGGRWSKKASKVRSMVEKTL
ncbi:hypothetical protein PGT21_010896 [Puccinia graminis f. sp. tritici]|uniref:Uncharacterized protein n=1 Tax=Puccinia graminis f. sp. tritici TaxID=56615 RepID=A0A5B0N3U6_PUCGR|nr:hypothetical protein PGTUg99_022528 [Puccinia graminis f. sp. tritici]KAA1083901.1 hypothetical protein PGT21_010896 [Puccinia graminis f. sp. tritici]